MRTIWKINNCNKLILFFTGWAMDENPTNHLQTADYDICVCFDYAKLETKEILRWQKYDEVILIAWSTGVWAAEQVIGTMNLPINKSIAINGTPITVHDEFGIQRSIFQGTYDNLNENNMQKFQRRMLGSKNALIHFSEFAPKRSIENQKKELEIILNIDFENLNAGSIKWDKAIIGLQDAIFPPQNQKAFWENKTIMIETEIPHFPFLEFTNWESILDL